MKTFILFLFIFIFTPLYGLEAGFSPAEILEFEDTLLDVTSIRDRFSRYFPNEDWNFTDPANLLNIFKPSEILSYELSNSTFSTVWEAWEKDKGPLGLTYSIINSFWIQQRVYKKDAYPWLIRYLRFFKNLDFGIPFTIEIDVVQYPPYARGPGRNSGVYFDGVVGLILSRQGVPAVHMSLNPTPKGVLVTQIQMAKKTGNRWLYKIQNEGTTYLEFFLNHLYSQAEKEGLPLWIVEGHSLARRIKNSYGTVDHSLMETFNRLPVFYNQIFSSFETAELSQIGPDLTFRRLEKRVHPR